MTSGRFDWLDEAQKCKYMGNLLQEMHRTGRIERAETKRWAKWRLAKPRSKSTNYVDVQERLGGRDDPRLLPLLACLVELLPWLKQWHNEVDPKFDMRMGDYFDGFVREEGEELRSDIGYN